MTQLKVQSLSVSRRSARLLGEVSFAAAAGEFIGVIGPNGAGKSTLLRAIAGLERSATGGVLIDDADIRAMSLRERARRIAFLPQARPVHWAMTADAVVRLGRFAFGESLRADVRGEAAISDAFRAAKAPAFRARIVPTLSGGEQARVHLARVFAGEASILLLDEPTAALDVSSALSIVATLKAKARAGAIILAALHDFALARRFCDRLLVLSGGALVSDGPPDLALREATLASVFEVEYDGAYFRLRSD
jgi:iron complex transport system ATP-binding protein